MTSKALQNAYFVRLCCINIDKTHFNYTIVKNRSSFYFIFWKGGAPPAPGSATAPVTASPEAHMTIKNIGIYVSCTICWGHVPEFAPF